MDMVKLTAVVGLLVALSVASERLVEIIKGLIPFLNKENPYPDKERIRRVALQCLAVAAGIATAFLARPTIPVDLIPANTTDVWPVIALGLLASGGSGFWNSVLTYVTSVKDLKEIDMLNRKYSLQKRLAGEPAHPEESTESHR
jgi:O-antigen/teichoic acid export membrane protein